MSEYLKDPNAVLDYKFDWATATNGNGFTDYLETGETIASHTITAETGLTLDSDAAADTDTSVIAWVSGGTAGTTYTLACRIVTSLGRTDERTIDIKVEQR